MANLSIIQNLDKPFVAYRSSAGSGKTFTLVKEYLRLLLLSDDRQYFSRILALTFTNKAANEMRERIVATLSHLSSEDYRQNDMLAVLTLPLSEGGTGLTEKEIHVKAQTVLKTLLHRYNNFGIGTIDKFTLKVVNAFAPDLHLPLHYDIQLNREELIARSVDLLLEQVGRDDFITDNLLKVVKDRFDEGKSWRVQNELKQIAAKLLNFSAENRRFLHQISADEYLQFIRQIEQLRRKKNQERIDLLNEFDNLLKQNNLSDDSFSGGYYPKKIRKLLHEDLTSDFGLNKTLTEQLETGIFHRKSEKPDIVAALERIAFQLPDLLQRALVNLGERALLSELKKTSSLLPFLSRVEELFETLKEENHILTLDDFSHILHESVKNEPAPFIYERIGEKYRHYLIDEFQDTSLQQWHNLLPLVENALSQNLFSLIVGDAKQAIYRFRGGEVEQFVSLPEIYKHQNNTVLLQQQKVIQRTFAEKQLTKNYRTGEQIVQFNNHLFKQLSAYLPEKYQPIYNALEQEPVKPLGNVRLRIFEEMDNGFYEHIRRYLLRDIEELTRQGYALKDIAILFRKNKEANEIAQFLNSNGYPVISSESLLVFAGKNVKLIYYFIVWLLDDKDVEIQFLLLYYFYLMVEKYSPDEAVKQTENIFYQAKQQSKRHRPEINVVSILQQHLQKNVPVDEYKKMAVFDLFEELLRLFGLNKNADNYLFAFSEAVYSFSQRQDIAPAAFIRWFDEQKEKLSINTPENADAITISTLHKAKGLEYPVVIFPYKITGLTVKPDDYFWLDISHWNTIVTHAPVRLLKIADLVPEWKNLKDQENGKIILDEINNLYVALTRPKYRLIWYVNKKSGDKYFIASEAEKLLSSDTRYEALDDEALTVERENADDLEFTVKTYQTATWAQRSAGETASVKQQHTPVALQYYPATPWFDKVKIAYQAPDYWDVDNPQSASEYGKMLHKMLSEVTRADDFSLVADKYLKNGIILPQQKHEVETLFTRMMQHRQVQAWFNTSSVLTEPAILLPDGKTYRPDRIVQIHNQTIVIDFKTGAKEFPHHRQVLNYIHLLQQVGFSNVEGYLLYLPEVEVEKV